MLESIFMQAEQVFTGHPVESSVRQHRRLQRKIWPFVIAFIALAVCGVVIILILEFVVLSPNASTTNSSTFS